MKISELSNPTIQTENDLQNLCAVLDEDILERLINHIKGNHFYNKTFCRNCQATLEALLPNTFPPSCGECGSPLIKLTGSLWARTYTVCCECGRGGDNGCGSPDGTYSLSDFYDSHSNWEEDQVR